MTFFCWDGFLCLDRRQYILVISMCDVAIKLLFFYPIGDTFVSVVGLTSMEKYHNIILDDDSTPSPP
jgi:hypothetical protein